MSFDFGQIFKCGVSIWRGLINGQLSCVLSLRILLDFKGAVAGQLCLKGSYYQTGVIGRPKAKVVLNWGQFRLFVPTGFILSKMNF